MYIQLYEPLKQRRIRIKNKIRLIVFVAIVIMLLWLLIPDCIKNVFLERFEATKAQLAYWLK